MRSLLRGILALGLLALVALPDIAHAGILPACANEPGGCKTLDQLIQLGVNYGRFIMGLAGSVALAVFVWGGVLFLISGGNADRVKQGRNKMVAAIIGLTIVFSAFTIVKFGLRFLDPTKKYDQYVTKPQPAQRR